ncbi:hypothetical protein DEU56DRAFT_918696 [Suillus clintonianus]|uniref:uncharacterized protein n=1 Tax=Suillus clintonianus TaxID=1904413 RepID=UPI001B876E5F|nr:uncharacterized protein DEU56DRAFT_918696 [Suillus clintonianus]KAG2119187.1 hypothetical protein DEU56DRAFT_918696 [Suillus clintonianus]
MYHNTGYGRSDSEDMMRRTDHDYGDLPSQPEDTYYSLPEIPEQAQGGHHPLSSSDLSGPAAQSTLSDAQYHRALMQLNRSLGYPQSIPAPQASLPSAAPSYFSHSTAPTGDDIHLSQSSMGTSHIPHPTSSDPSPLHSMYTPQAILANAAAQTHLLNDYDGSLPLPIMVPSQGTIRPSDLALPPAIADYRRSFPPPLISLDGVSTLPPAAPDDVQPLARTPAPRPLKRKSSFSWQFIPCSGQRQKMAPLSVPATMASDPIPTGSTQPHIELPPLKYQANHPTHDDFVLAAQKLIIRDAVNNCAMIKPSAREGVIQATLADAVKDHLTKAHGIRSDSADSVKKTVQDFSQRWAAENTGSLYMTLSAPFKLIMAVSKEIALNVVDRGYDLRPSLWSDTSESKWKQTKINDLVNDVTWPLKFIFKRDEKTNQWMAFEHDAILDVVIGVVRKLKYQHYVNNLDNLYCTAVAAIYCVFKQYSSGKLQEMEFTAQAFKFMYDMSKKHITDVIEKDEDLAKRWLDVKALTIVRLADVAS